LAPPWALQDMVEEFIARICAVNTVCPQRLAAAGSG
jgi:hypothetical protein